MRRFTAGELTRIVEGVLVGDPETLVGPGVAVDSRQAAPGTLFVAIVGERVDGHDFVGAAAERRASAAFVTHEVAAPLVQIVVDDPIKALSELARFTVAEAEASGLVSQALTGSSGKTSTKDLLAQILAAAGETVAPVGNHNNEIGVPLTAVEVVPGTRYLVGELGARKIGDVAWLCSIVQPRHAAILNIGTAHVGEFGSKDAIAQAKGEIVEALPADGCAVLNAEDPYVAGCAARTRARICWFTTSDGPIPDGDHVRATDISADAAECYSFTLQTDIAGHQTSDEVHLQVVGRHQVANSLAAAALAIAAGLSPEQVAGSLSAATQRSVWRMEISTAPSGATVINDSYNANPESVKAAIDTLVRLGEAATATNPQARTIAVLGDMAELGASAQAEHRAIGEYLAAAGVDEVIAVGEFAAELVAPLATHSVLSRIAERDDVAPSLVVGAGDVVLVKASRALGLEAVAAALLHDGASGPTLGEEEHA